MDSSVMSEEGPKPSGMSARVATYFVIAQMAGAGFLALPQALAKTGWLGAPLLAIIAVSVGYSGMALAHCWLILEERWPEYKTPIRQPYMEIAYRSFGMTGRRVMQVSVKVTLIGTSIVMLILISQFLHSLFPNVSICLFICIVATGMTPLSWLGTPKDFWQASVLATISILVSCTVIIVQLALDKDTEYIPDDPVYDNPSVSSFSLGFSSILFAFGGAAVFPTIQNDMEDRSQFWKCVCVAFTCLLLLYMPVSVLGYAYLGSDVPSNILLYRGHALTTCLIVAVVFEIFNLLATFLIIMSPVFQGFEEMLKIPQHFSVKRVSFRTAMIVFVAIIAMALPEFGYILNLVGGSTITLCSFVAPSSMYLKLIADRSNKDWPERNVSKWKKIYLYEIIIIGGIGGVIATVSSIFAIITADFSNSCFVNFSNH